MIFMKKLLIFILLIVPIVIFAQCIDGNCEQGSGQFKFKNGIYVGDFVDGNLTGEGLWNNGGFRGPDVKEGGVDYDINSFRA